MKPPIKKNKSQRSNEDLRISSSKNLRLVEKKHQQIVDGACRIFFEKGYHPTTIRMIANACGMSMGQLYHYIHSKDDVLYLVHKHMQKVWYDYIKKSDMEKIDDPLQKLTEALRYTLEFMNENKRLIQFVYTESKYLDKKHLHIVLEMAYNNVIGFWHSLLKEVNQRKSVKGDLEFLASLIAFLLVFLPLRGWTLRGKPTGESADSLVDFILRGLGVLQ
ncbi:MAG: TetR/AcrR family transcriptional regulator [Thermodesulfobacteriota bacterium]